MKPYAAFLRGVSPMNAKMPDLRRSLEDAGFSEVRTLLSSGNVVFHARSTSTKTLERKVESAIEKGLGHTFLTIVRPIEALRAIVEADPFASFRLKPRSKRVITFLRSPPKAKLDVPLELDGAKILCVRGSEVYTSYVPSPKGAAFMRLIEKTFGKDITTRTWDTVKKVAR